MNHSFTQLLVRWGILALGVVIATQLIPGIHCENGITLLVVVVLLSFCNTILKPILVLFTLPFILITMGLGVVVINALLFLLVGKLIDGFYVQGFWPAVGGAIVVSLTNLIVSRLIRGTSPKRPANPPGTRPAKRNDVIDI